jgi:tripartite-type tricarboxylate transporter receptor subunit TctC
MTSVSVKFRRSCGIVRAIAGIAIAAIIFSTGAAVGQTYPSRPIRLVLPFLPGTPNDVVARVLGPRLSAVLKQPVIIDNRPGGSTIIGTRAVATADADGYTLLLTANNHVIVPAQSAHLDYDALKDFAPVAGVAKTSWLLTVSPSVPVKTVPELIAYARKNPGKLNIGFGKGTSPEIVSEMFKLEAKADIASVPYKGGAQVLTDMLGGTVQLNFGQTSTSLPLIRSGKLRALAVTSATRLHDLPDVPTMIESGISSLSGLSFWDGVLAPAGAPAEIVNRLNQEINESLKSPEVKASLDKLGFEPLGGTPQDFAAFLQAEFPKWAAMVKATGIQLH